MSWLTAVRRFAQSSNFPVRGLAAHVRTYRRAATVAAIVLAAVAALCGALAMVTAVTAPATVPVAISGTVLSKSAELFGAGDGDKHLAGVDIYEAGKGARITCEPVPATSTLTPAAPGAPAVLDDEADKEDLTESEAESDQSASPAIEIGTDGSVNRDDAKKLVNPVPPGTSALTAHVWFLYRLSGLGDWDAFIAAYHDKGLRGDDESEDAPLAQVQALNISGAQMERYRLTAASLALSGLYTGRFADPYPEYRELLSTELLSTCFADSEVADQRMTLPPAAVTSSVPAPEEVTPPAHSTEQGLDAVEEPGG